MPEFSKAAQATTKPGILPFDDSVALFNECMDIFGYHCLRGGNFPPYMTIKASAFDPEDQHVALKAYVDLITAAGTDDARINELRSKMETYFGAIDQPFVACLRGLNYRIVPPGATQ